MGYIWQCESWPNFYYDKEKVNSVVAIYNRSRSRTYELFQLLSSEAQTNFLAENLASEAVYSSLIEGESIKFETVLSSVLRKLDPEMQTKIKSDRNAETTAELILDATNSKERELSENLLLYWHKLLFEGLPKANRPEHVGQFRKGNIYVRSYDGKFNETVKYEAVPGSEVEKEISIFIEKMSALNGEPIILSAIASFYLVSIHPFEDGNGRISRAVGDFYLSREGGLYGRFISMSSGLCRARSEYYNILEQTQKQEDLDITNWIVWYINRAIFLMDEAYSACGNKIRLTMMMHNAGSRYNGRQLNMLYRLASGSFYGRLNAEKWSRLTKCTSATAFRDIEELVTDGYLERKVDGRNSYYILSPGILENLKA